MIRYLVVCDSVWCLLRFWFTVGVACAVVIYCFGDVCGVVCVVTYGGCRLGYVGGLSCWLWFGVFLLVVVWGWAVPICARVFEVRMTWFWGVSGSWWLVALLGYAV